MAVCPLPRGTLSPHFREAWQRRWHHSEPMCPRWTAVPGYVLPLGGLLYGIGTDHAALMTIAIPWLLVSALLLWLVGVLQ
jgi:hypothetical protein